MNDLQLRSLVEAVFAYINEREAVVVDAARMAATDAADAAAHRDWCKSAAKDAETAAAGAEKSEASAGQDADAASASATIAENAAAFAGGSVTKAAEYAAAAQSAAKAAADSAINAHRAACDASSMETSRVEAAAAAKKAEEYAAAAMAAAVSLAAAVESAQASERYADRYADTAVHASNTAGKSAAAAAAAAAAASRSAAAADKAANEAAGFAGSAAAYATAADLAAECKAAASEDAARVECVADREAATIRASYAAAEDAPRNTGAPVTAPRYVTFDGLKRSIRWDEHGTPFFILEPGYQHGHVWQSWEEEVRDVEHGPFRCWRCRYCGRAIVVLGERATGRTLKIPGFHEFPDDPTSAPPVADDPGTR